MAYLQSISKASSRYPSFPIGHFTFSKASNLVKPRRTPSPATLPFWLVKGPMLWKIMLKSVKHIISHHCWAIVWNLHRIYTIYTTALYWFTAIYCWFSSIFRRGRRWRSWPWRPSSGAFQPPAKRGSSPPLTARRSWWFDEDSSEWNWEISAKKSRNIET